MSIEIKNRYTGVVIEVVDAESLEFLQRPGANLRGADLREADLREADLREADLREADLYGANLYGANLYGADLYGADLRGADLYGADLYGAGVFVAYFDRWPVQVTRQDVRVGCQTFTLDNAIEGIKAVAPDYEVEGWRLENLLAVVQVGMDGVKRMPEQKPQKEVSQ